MLNSTISIIAILLIVAGSIWLQVFLSRKRNKWLGLIIPFVCFILSILTVLAFTMYTVTDITESTKTIELDGYVVRETMNEVVSTTSEKPSMISMLATATPVFLIFNIPTLIFLAIYFACREKIKLRNELDKMNVQDLE